VVALTVTVCPDPNTLNVIVPVMVVPAITARQVFTVRVAVDTGPLPANVTT
jgi:hypothetical protein